MRVLYFGTYERDYPRNAQVISCLRRAGVQVDERHVGIWEGRRHKLSLGARGVGRLALAEARLAVSSAADADALIVGYPGHADVLSAKRAAGGRPIVFNPLVSLEDTMIGDRALVSPRGITAKALRLVDRTAFGRSDLVIADTAAQARYFADAFGLPAERVGVCFVGAEDRLFLPGPRASGQFTVLFVGKLIPLHGLETILGAAALCPDIEFHVVGSGQLDEVLESEACERASRTVGRVRAASGPLSLRWVCTRHLRRLGESRTGHPEQGLPGSWPRRRRSSPQIHPPRASCSRTDAMHSSCLLQTPRRSRSRCVVSPRIRCSEPRSRRADGRRTRRTPPRTCSASGGAN